MQNAERAGVSSIIFRIRMAVAWVWVSRRLTSLDPLDVVRRFAGGAATN